jgi:hypothetical protein
MESSIYTSSCLGRHCASLRAALLQKLCSSGELSKVLGDEINTISTVIQSCLPAQRGSSGSPRSRKRGRRKRRLHPNLKRFYVSHQRRKQCVS